MLNQILYYLFKNLNSLSLFLFITNFQSYYTLRQFAYIFTTTNQYFEFLISLYFTHSLTLFTNLYIYILFTPPLLLSSFNIYLLPFTQNDCFSSVPVRAIHKIPPSSLPHFHLCYYELCCIHSLLYLLFRCHLYFLFTFSHVSVDISY